MARICHMWLEIYLSYQFHGLPAGCVCVAAACGASATSKKNTPLDFGNMPFMDFVVFCDFELS